MAPPPVPGKPVAAGHCCAATVGYRSFYLAAGGTRMGCHLVAVGRKSAVICGVDCSRHPMSSGSRESWPGANLAAVFCSRQSFRAKDIGLGLAIHQEPFSL
ncbi:hypothetical protein BCR43DRAFT_489566 [Syncephalastrum racemosum]|uniref:Uncharacterized protein n=1 Tax=Syncephalastrum racemosum TaxID=13706 RepID=A0A1X2HEH0_SYNRA|nr:hypothetical protein BCR43DRAFT_489566 [Syncephalastrum racemosum]